MKYNKSLILVLNNYGYRQKLIRIITGYPQALISKTINNPRNILPTLTNITEEQQIRKYVIDRVLELRGLPTPTFNDEDKAYIRLLDYLLVDQDRIRKLYYNVSQYRVSQALRGTKIDWHNFKPEMIDLEQEYWDEFVAAADAI